MTTVFRKMVDASKALMMMVIAGFLFAYCDAGDKDAPDETADTSDTAGTSDTDEGESISVPGSNDGDEDVCVGDLAEDTFRFALCTCRDATSMGVLTTGSFDSFIDRFMLTHVVIDDYGAAIGINRDLAVPGVLSVGGSAVLSGPHGVALPGLTTVQGDLEAAANVEFAGVLNVARDLVVGEDFVNLGDGNIGRDLYLGGAMTLPFLTIPKGQLINESKDVPPPCPCEPDDLIDIRKIVADARNNHQDDVIGINPDGLTAIVGYMDLDLPPGRYYFSTIAGAGKLTLNVTGHTALFIDGDMLLAGDLAIKTTDTATLDVFIAGDFRIAGANDFGSIARPSAVRFYVAGSNDVTLTGYTAFVGSLYAPNADVILTGATYVYGSVFAGNFLAMGDTGIYYDRDINRGGDDCDDDDPPDKDTDDGDDTPGDDTDDTPDDTCLSYDEDCVTDADCCEPLVCDEGTCKELVIVV